MERWPVAVGLWLLATGIADHRAPDEARRWIPVVLVQQATEPAGDGHGHSPERDVSVANSEISAGARFMCYGCPSWALNGDCSH